MNRSRKFRMLWAVALVTACSTVFVGCSNGGQNLSINIVIPLGLGGTPGILNPFGIVQAIVNAIFGGSPSETTTGTSGTGGTSTSGAQNPQQNISTITTVT